MFENAWANYLFTAYLWCALISGIGVSILLRFDRKKREIKLFSTIAYITIPPINVVAACLFLAVGLLILVNWTARLFALLLSKLTD